jgi:NADH:ubiquinone oxidoreductase subunit D
MSRAFLSNADHRCESSCIIRVPIGESVFRGELPHNTNSYYMVPATNKVAGQVQARAPIKVHIGTAVKIPGIIIHVGKLLIQRHSTKTGKTPH